MHDDADSESGRLMSERGGDGEQAPASAYRCRESAPSSRSPARFPILVSHIDAGVPVRGGDHAQQTLEQLRVRQRKKPCQRLRRRVCSRAAPATNQPLGHVGPHVNPQAERLAQDELLL